MNNKPLLLLTLLCGFLLGVIAGPWLWPRDLLQSAPAKPAPPPPQAAAALTPPPPPPAPEPMAEQVPSEDRLVLKGVFVGAKADRSRALIAQGDGEPRLYKVDDKLPDGSVLKAVNNKEVEIEKNGQPQTLAIERGTPGSAEAESPPETPTPATTVNDTDAAPAATSSRREAVAQQREALLEKARNQPQLEGEAPPESTATPEAAPSTETEASPP